MDLPRNLPGTPASRALLRGARDLVGFTAAAVVTCLLLVLLTWLGARYWLADRFSSATPIPARSAVAAASEAWTTQDVEYRSHGARIAALLYLPSGKGPHPALVVAHGSGMSLRGRYEHLAAPLVARGYAFLSYDKRGVGNSEGTYSGVGQQNSVAMFDLLSDDVVAGIEYLKSRGDIDAGRIGVLGISQGGWIGPLAAAKSRSVSFLVIVSGPAVSVGEENFYSDLTLEREGRSQVGSDAELTSKLAAFRGPHGFDPVPVLASLEVPGLWILGSADRSIPIPETVERLESLIAAGRPFTLEVLPGVGHGMFDVETGMPVPTATIATDWLEELEGRLHARR